ncbi:MAG TPA: hypothetical protein VEI03_12075 [Stellaceae bacterium]|nr:hypothetical protein [Stellaceae bacterium]
MRPRPLLLFPWLLAACGGGAPSPTAAPVDATLQRETRAGRLAYELERAGEAVASYRAALTRAQERDDLGAIGDLGYNLSVAELRANMPDRALADARATRAELERRGAEAFPALLLAEATALYRLGAAADADAVAARVAADKDGEAAARATFLRGLIADEHDNAQGLAAAAAALAAATAPSLQADAAELAARLALRQGDPARARREAATAARLRQDTLDYRGLARALAIEGEAALGAEDGAEAADLFLRAGRSALAQDDREAARRWLERAISLRPQGAVAEAATELLGRIDRGER